MNWPLPWLLTSEHLVPSLVHTLWQGVVVAVVLSVALLLLPAQRAQLRYVLSLAALVAVVAGWLITWNVLEQMAPHAPATNTQEARVAVGSPPALTAIRIETDGHSALDPDAAARRLPNSSGAARAPIGWASWRRPLVAGWLLGVGILSLRLVVSLVGAYREAGRALASPGITHELTRELCERLGVTRSVRVAAVERLHLPAVIGVIWPTILLPVTLLGETSSEQLRFILAHELAHIRRHDYLINLAQMAVETLLFFNPAVWWISRRVRTEREACCDALAVAALGNAAGYARTLVDLASREAAMTTVAVGFAPTPVSELRERVSRLLLGSYRPRLGVAPWSLLGLSLLGGLALAGLSSGTGLAVAVAAEIMSPAERIERITQAEKQYVEVPLEEGKLQISGTMKNADGGPISKKIQLQNNVYRKSPSSTSSTQKTMSAKDGKFTDTVNSGELWVWGQQPGYALALVGPIAARASAPPGPLELVFNRGFTGQLLITDAQGKPVTGATVDASQHVEAAGFLLPVGKFTTDAFGQAALEHLDHLDVAPIKVNVEAPGFQEIKGQKIVVAPERVTTLKLRPAVVSSGVVTYEANGEPAVGARLVTQQVTRQTPGHSEGFNEAKLLAICDAQGRFTLDTLADNLSYDLVVEGTDGSRTKLIQVHAGNTKLQVKLPKPIVVRGTVLHPELLPKDKILRYTNQRMNYGETPVTVRDGVGHFEFTGILPPDLTIWTPRGIGMPVDLNGPLDNVVVDLANTQQRWQPRQVTVKLVPPEGMPLPTGTLHVGSLSEGVPIKNGEATFSVPPGMLYVGPVGMAGYWFPPLNVDVAKGAETLAQTIQVRPAGAITGTASWLKPIPKQEPRFQLIVLDKSPQLLEGEYYSPEVRAKSNGERFLASPLPLDGTYCVLLVSGGTAVLSDPVVVDEQHPFVQLDLPRPEASNTIDAAGTVTDTDGRPLAGVRVVLEVNARIRPNQSHSTNLASAVTDDAGKYAFTGIHLEPRLSYLLIASRNGHQPAAQLQYEPTVEPLAIQLAAGHRLRLVVIDDAQGRAVEGAFLQIHPPGDDGFGNTRYQRTNDRGEMDIDTLPEGEMQVHVNQHVFTVPTDAETPFELHLNAEGPGKGRVRSVE